MRTGAIFSILEHLAAIIQAHLFEGVTTRGDTVCICGTVSKLAIFGCALPLISFYPNKNVQYSLLSWDNYKLVHLIVDMCVHPYVR